MSSFFVGNKLISKLANTIKVYYPQVLEDLNVKNSQELSRLLYNLNVEALRQRYDDDYIDMIKDFEYDEGDGNFYFIKEDKELAQFFMNLECFLYQCREGNVPDKEEFKVLERLSTDLAYEIAFKFSHEKGAKWGED